MAEKKFKFVSPGIFLHEIDNSGNPNQGADIGPVVIGRTLRGPALRPVTVKSYSEFITIFGNPLPGGRGDDVWRDGDTLGPTYAAYAAQAWLRNNAPITMMRLLGDQSQNPAGEGYAGWGGGNKTSPVNFGSVADSSPGGAYGLFVMNSGSTVHNAGIGQAAVLAAVFYSNNTVTPALYGTPISGTTPGTKVPGLAATATASQGVVFPTNSAGNFEMYIGTHAQIGAATAEKFEFNFQRSSDKYIRKVFNTNPTLLNSEITSGDATRTYFLGESFDAALRTGSLGDSKNQTAGGWRTRNTNISGPGDLNNAIVVGLETGGGQNWSDNAFETKEPVTGWIVGQDLGEATSFTYGNAQKLFRIHGLNHGEWLQKNLKVTIEMIKPSQNDFDSYGTFTVTLRRIEDNDKAPVVVERFTNLNLNPNSTDYIARKLGDKHVAWDYNEHRLREYGTYNNQSKFMRVEVNADLDDGALDARYVPFGFHGAPQWNNLIAISGTFNSSDNDIAGTPLNLNPWLAAEGIAEYDNTIVGISGSLPGEVLNNIAGGSTTPSGTPEYILALTCSYFMPALPLRISASAGNMGTPTNACFGVTVGRADSYNTYDESVVDFLRAPGGDLDVGSNSYQRIPYIFTLDDISASYNSAVYVSGSRTQTTTGRSLSAIYGYGAVLTGAVLDSGEGHIGGFDKFTCLFHGGFDGLDITEKDAFRNQAFVTSPTEDNDYRFYTVKRAIDTLRDPEYVEFNLATVPGINVESLTAHLVETCEERADALALIDLTGDYVPRTENTQTAAQRRPNVAEAVRNLKLRSLNSSYGATYFPWVQIRDTISNQVVDVPPSVVALGTISNSEAKKALWFAPAGFTRGGLSEGAAGLPVVGVKYQLNAKERDDLYGANINPIATFPAEGIVIFGQKTLQVTPSALDRVNVRRLLIFIKKQVSRIAATTLFEQNIQATWDSFSNRVESLLSGIQAAQGLMDYRVVLDKSTTTPELIDRNIMYAKVFLKPARSIEFVALDFVVTDSGASFDD